MEYKSKLRRVSASVVATDAVKQQFSSVVVFFDMYSYSIQQIIRCGIPSSWNFDNRPWFAIEIKGETQNNGIKLLIMCVDLDIRQCF